MKFDTEKCAMLIMKSGKHHMKNGVELPNQEKNRKNGRGKQILQIRGNTGS